MHTHIRKQAGGTRRRTESMESVWILFYYFCSQKWARKSQPPKALVIQRIRSHQGRKWESLASKMAFATHQMLLIVLSMRPPITSEAKPGRKTGGQSRRPTFRRRKSRCICSADRRGRGQVAHCVLGRPAQVTSPQWNGASMLAQTESSFPCRRRFLLAAIFLRLSRH